MSLEKHQQKNTKQKTQTHLNLSYVDNGNVHGPYIYIFKYNLNTIKCKPMRAIYKYKSVWILNKLKWTLLPTSKLVINNSI